MEQAVAFDAVRGWRTVAIVAGGVAAVELVVLVAGGLALAGRPLWRHIGQTTAPKRPVAKPHHVPTVPPASPIPHRARGRTTVLVLNGNGRQGAAAAESELVRRQGYRIGAVGNAARMSYGQSVVMYRGGFRGEALRLAHDLGIRLVGPLDGLRPGDLRRSQVVVVVGE